MANHALLLRHIVIVIMAAPAATRELSARVASQLADYSAQGVHRTGTDVDWASARWLQAELEAAGVPSAAITQREWPLQRLDAGPAYLHIEGSCTLGGLGMFDCGSYTDLGGVAGTVGWAGASDAAIGVVLVDDANDASDSQKLNAVRAEPGPHQLIVAGLVLEKSVKGLALGNAPNFSADLAVHAGSDITGASITGPWGPPVLQLPSDAIPLLIQAVESGSSAVGVCAASRTAATACNVECEVVGSRPELAPVVVITPRSGWWACASERGPGISAFIELARAAAAAADPPLARTVIFSANSGHECGHLGADAFSKGAGVTGADAHCWIHLGANFGSTNEGTDPTLPADRPTAFTYQCTDGATESQLLRHLNAAKDSATAEMAGRMEWRAGWVGGSHENALHVPLGGEAVNVHAEGGRFVSLVGVNQMFHHPADVFAHDHPSLHDCCDVPKLTLVIEAMTRLLVELAAEPEPSPRL